MKFITTGHLEPILQEITGPFDTHKLEQELLRRDSHAFAKELLQHRDVTVFSNQFALWFDREFNGRLGRVRQTRQARSTNLVGNKNLNQEWEKVPTPTN